MMRLSVLILLMLSTLTIFGQVCSPDPAVTQAGIYPDSATGIPPAQAGTPYELVATILAPTDTLAIVIPGTPAQVVLIDSIVLDTLLGLPSWASYTCEPAGCAFAGGAPGCVLIGGTPGPGEAGLSYEIGFVTISYGRLQLLPGIQLPPQVDSTLNYYNLIIAPGTSVTAISPTPSVYPNPATDMVTLSLDSYATYRITDISGRTIASGQGAGIQQIAVRDWPKGVYLATIMGREGNPTIHKVVVQ